MYGGGHQGPLLLSVNLEVDSLWTVSRKPTSLAHTGSQSTRSVLRGSDKDGSETLMTLGTRNPLGAVVRQEPRTVTITSRDCPSETGLAVTRRRFRETPCTLGHRLTD